MFFNPVKGIINRCLKNDSFKILTAVCHASWESMLCKALPNYNFYGYRDQGIIAQWTPNRPQPKNYSVLEYGKGDASIPSYVDFHCVFTQNVGAQWRYLHRYAEVMNIPNIVIHHTMPPIGYTQDTLRQYQNLPAAHTVFITDYSRRLFGFDEHNSTVVYHAIDNETFKPLNLERKPVVMTLVNNYEQRWRECGFQVYQHVANGFPTKHFGNTPPGEGNLPNDPANDIDQLNIELNTTGVFLNTSLWSPLPMSLLESAMAATPIVSTNTCAIPEVFQDGRDMIMFDPNKPQDGRKAINHLLNNPDEAQAMGQRARETALRVFNIDRFAQQWRSIFTKAIKEF